MVHTLCCHTPEHGELQGTTRPHAKKWMQHWPISPATLILFT